MLAQYAKRVTDIYNEHAKLHNTASAKHDWVGESVHALVCNGIALQVAKSTHQELKDYFHIHASN